VTNLGTPAADLPPPAPRARLKRLLTWALALVALGFVAWVVPVRDRCVDPDAGALSPKVTMTREADGCILHRPSGDVHLEPARCQSLACEAGLASTLKRARVGVVALLAVAYFFSMLTWAVRWRALLRLAGVEASPWSAWRVTIEAQAGGVLLPGGVAGDALRIAAMVGRGGRTAKVVASVLVERVLGLATFALLAVLAAVALDRGSVDRSLLVFLGAIPVGFVVFWTVVRRLGVGAARWLPRPLRPLLEYACDPDGTRALLRASGASILTAAANLLIVRGLVFALGATPASEGGVFLGTTMSFIVTALPTLPGAWGTGDAAYVFFLGRAGVEPSVALAVCLLYRLFWYLSGAVGAVLLLAKRSAAVAATTPKPE
jgi:uncharacterized membrane protein YbhN (UPF0104 family)